MIELRENWWAVEVPSMAFGFDVNNYADESEYMYMLSMEDIADDSNCEETLITKSLPPGTWQIICTSKGATEEVLKVMDDVLQHNNFKEWFQNFNGRLSYYYNRLSSFSSLLTSKGCDLNINYLILKKG